jgi:hypothetical protein
MAVCYGIYISETIFFETIAHKKLGKRDLKTLALSVDLSDRAINDAEDLRKILEKEDYLEFLSSLHHNNTYFEDYIKETTSLCIGIIADTENEENIIFIGTKKYMKHKIMMINELEDLISKEKKLKAQQKIGELGLGHIPLILTICDEPYGSDNPEASRGMVSLVKKDKV